MIEASSMASSGARAGRAPWQGRSDRRRCCQRWRGNTSCVPSAQTRRNARLKMAGRSGHRAAALPFCSDVSGVVHI